MSVDISIGLEETQFRSNRMHNEGIKGYFYQTATSDCFFLSLISSFGNAERKSP